MIICHFFSLPTRMRSFRVCAQRASTAEREVEQLREQLASAQLSLKAGSAARSSAEDELSADSLQATLEAELSAKDREVGSTCTCTILIFYWRLRGGAWGSMLWMGLRGKMYLWMGRRWAISIYGWAGVHIWKDMGQYVFVYGAGYIVWRWGGGGGGEERMTVSMDGQGCTCGDGSDCGFSIISFSYVET